MLESECNSNLLECLYR